MIAVDTSALTAIVFDEAERPASSRLFNGPVKP
jgi:uncharacterized protein with PIN domain